MRKILLFLSVSVFLFTCNELNNPYDANSTAGSIVQTTTPKDTSKSAIITVVYDTAQSRTLIIFYFDSTHSDTLVDSLAPRTHVDTLQLIDSIHYSDTTIIKKTSYDTILFQDTVTLTRFDTLHLSRYDTTWITRFDTTHINKYDTTHVFHYDTTHISQHDTTHFTSYDTVHVTKYDTTHVTKYDTTHITKYDTLQINPKPHLSFLGLINTGGCWTKTLDTLSPKPCTLYTNDYRYGDCSPIGSSNPSNCSTSPSEIISFYFSLKFSCPSADSIRYYVTSPMGPSYNSDTLYSDNTSIGYTRHSSSTASEQYPDGFHLGTGVYQFRFSARCIKPYSTPLADWRYLTVVVLSGPGPGGSPGLGKVRRLPN